MAVEQVRGAGHGRLVQLCLDAACRDKESVRLWRKQRRTLERMPAQLAEPLLHQLLANRLLSPPLLEAFQHCVQELDLSGELAVDAEWMAYVGGFRHLRVLKLNDCKSLTSSAISAMAGMESLEELQLCRCKKLTNEALEHISTLSSLKRLGLAETGLGQEGQLSKISVMTNLTHLDLGGLPVTDADIAAFQTLQELVHLDLWGSLVTNKGAWMLRSFSKLKEVNLAWTVVSVVPFLPALSYLDMSSCTIHSLFQDCGEQKDGLDHLLLSGAVIDDSVLSSFQLKSVSVLCLSSTNLTDFRFLSSLGSISKLDLSSNRITDDELTLLSNCGRHLQWLDLSGTRVSSAGIGALVGCFPALNQISLERTCVNDEVFACLGLIPSLTSINLSQNNIKGTKAVLHLQQLPNLKHLDLRQTALSDKSCKSLACLVQLSELLLRSEFLTNKSLHALAALPNLSYLVFQGSVLTNAGLLSFKAPLLLETLDLTDCWLLTAGAISQFCAINQHIDVKHEFQLSRHSSRTRRSGPLVKETAATGAAALKDERLRYSKLDLLKLQSGSLGEVKGLPSFLRLDGAGL